MSTKTRQRTTKIATDLTREMGAVHTEVSRLKRINRLLAELDELIAKFEVKNNIRPCKRCGKMAFRHYHTCTTKL